MGTIHVMLAENSVGDVSQKFQNSIPKVLASVGFECLGHCAPPARELQWVGRTGNAFSYRAMGVPFQIRRKRTSGTEK
jgi:hypothetical protein